MIPVLLIAAAAAPTVPTLAYHIADQWRELGVEVTLKAEECGYVNAWYTYGTGTVTLCTELFSSPELTEAVLNHEMGHAMFDQLGIPAEDEEYLADEVSWWMNSPAANLAVTRFWLSQANDEQSKDDPHPAALDRARMFICMDEGKTGADPLCAVFVRSSFAHWATLLRLAL